MEVASNEMQFWLDGRKVVHVTGRATAANACRGDDLQDEWRAPPKFDSFYIGFERYADSANDQNLWIDDVALSKRASAAPAPETRRESMKIFEPGRCRGTDGPAGFALASAATPKPAPAPAAAAPAPVAAPVPPPPPLVDPAAIDSALKSLIDSKKVIGVSALVYERGKEVYFGAFGLADRENNKPMARDTVVQIFSMTKPVTGVALMQLYERGKFELDAPLAVYAPEFAEVRVYAGLDASGQPKYRSAEAADHRARHPAPYGGIPRRWIARGGHGYLPPDRSRATSTTRCPRSPRSSPRCRLRYQPGTQWIYSDVVDVQAYLVQKISGVPFDEYLKLHIFRPLGMTCTRYTILPTDPDRPQLAAIYTRNEDGTFTRQSDEEAYRFNSAALAAQARQLRTRLHDRRLHEVRAHVVRRRETGPRAHPQARDRASSWPPTPCRRKSPTSRGCPARGRWASASTSRCASRRRRTRRKPSGAVGEFFWDGAASTLFWVDPKNDITAVLFTQLRAVRPGAAAQDFPRRRVSQRPAGARPLAGMEQKLGFGFIGAGAIAHFHARAVAAAEGGRLVGVVSRTRATAEKFAAEHGIGFASDDVHQLLAQPGLDAVCITTPSALHLEPALAAIRAGKHLMIEKPLDSTVEGTDHILHEAAKAGVRVGSIFQARFGDAARQLKAAIDAGRFGRMVLASCYVKWNRTAEYYTGWKGRISEDGGGAVINQAIHGVDLLQWFAGMPVEVFAWTTQRVHAHRIGRHLGRRAEVSAAARSAPSKPAPRCGPGSSRRIEICGENGSAVMEDDDITRWEFRVAQPEDEKIRAARESSAKGSGAANPMAINFEGHLRQIQDFIDGIRERRPFFIEGSEARKAVALVRAIYDSAASGRRRCGRTACRRAD